MVTIALTSARSSPGVTALATGLSLALDELDGPSALIEADPTGGVLGHRFGVGGEKDMLTYTAEIRKGFEPGALFNHTRGLGRVHCLLAPVDPRASERALIMSAATLAKELPRYKMHTTVDCGRISERSASLPFLAAADHALVVARPTLEEIQSALFAVRVVAKARSVEPSLVLIGDDPYTSTEITRSLGLKVEGIVADDGKLSRALCGGLFTARKFRRSVLMRSINALAEHLISASPPQSMTSEPIGRAESDMNGADQVGVLRHG